MMPRRLSLAASSAISCAALALPAASSVAAAVPQHTALLIVACTGAQHVSPDRGERAQAQHVLMPWQCRWVSRGAAQLSSRTDLHVGLAAAAGGPSRGLAARRRPSGPAGKEGRPQPGGLEGHARRRHTV